MTNASESFICINVLSIHMCTDSYHCFVQMTQVFPHADIILFVTGFRGLIRTCRGRIIGYWL